MLCRHEGYAERALPLSHPLWGQITGFWFDVFLGEWAPGKWMMLDTMMHVATYLKVDPTRVDGSGHLIKKEIEF